MTLSSIAYNEAHFEMTVVWDLQDLEMDSSHEEMMVECYNTYALMAEDMEGFQI